MAETFINKTIALGNSADASVYAPGSGETAIIIHAQVANVDGTNAADLYMDLYDTSTTTAAALAHKISVPASAAILPIGGKLVLETTDQLRAWAGAASDLELTLGILVLT